MRSRSWPLRWCWRRWRCWLVISPLAGPPRSIRALHCGTSRVGNERSHIAVEHTVSAVLTHGLTHPPSEHTSLCATAYISTALPTGSRFWPVWRLATNFVAGAEILADLDPAFGFGSRYPTRNLHMSRDNLMRNAPRVTNRWLASSPTSQY